MDAWGVAALLIAVPLGYLLCRLVASVFRFYTTLQVLKRMPHASGKGLFGWTGMLDDPTHLPHALAKVGSLQILRGGLGGPIVRSPTCAAGRGAGAYMPLCLPKRTGHYMQTLWPVLQQAALLHRLLLTPRHGFDRQTAHCKQTEVIASHAVQVAEENGGLFSFRTLPSPGAQFGYPICIPNGGPPLRWWGAAPPTPPPLSSRGPCI
jgi:hypothetical protein